MRSPVSYFNYLQNSAWNRKLQRALKVSDVAQRGKESAAHARTPLMRRASNPAAVTLSVTLEGKVSQGRSRLRSASWLRSHVDARFCRPRWRLLRVRARRNRADITPNWRGRLLFCLLGNPGQSSSPARISTDLSLCRRRSYLANSPAPVTIKS